MKALFVSYNQAITDRVMSILERHGGRGYTKWALTEGRGTHFGEPHLGTHAWPSMNSSVLMIVDDHRIEPLLEALRKADKEAEQQGLRAFVWDIIDAM
jgi:hypothetical protein